MQDDRFTRDPDDEANANDPRSPRKHINYQLFVGKTIGEWTVISRERRWFSARCTCGALVSRISAHSIVTGVSKCCRACGYARRVMPIIDPRVALAQKIRRFWENVVPEPTTGCWLWAGHQTTNGYGQVRRGILNETRSHRIAWQLERGAIPVGLCALHKCDTPLCVNPTHLFLGTRPENTDDMVRKVRFGRKLEPQQVNEIRALREAGMKNAAIGEHFGVTAGTVSKITTRRTWCHVG